MIQQAHLEVALTGPTVSLPAGASFMINVTVSHNSIDSRDARNLVVFLDFLEQYVLPPANFTSFFSNNTSSVHGKS